jgi:hypothetical protein
MSIVLYSQIFECNPDLTGEKNARNILEQRPELIQSIIDEIDRELNYPTQKVSEIHEFVYPNEDKLRKHLRDVSEYLKMKINAQSS